MWSTARFFLGCFEQVSLVLFPSRLYAIVSLRIVEAILVLAYYMLTVASGWSTTILTSKGTLHSVGVLNSMTVRQTRVHELCALRFPPGYTQPGDNRYNPYSAIRQFSSGRYHILGLSDSGSIWSWYNIGQPALHIKFLHFDVVENGGTISPQARGSVRKVVAGWDKSSAYVGGVGIVLWDVVRRSPQDEQDQLDTMLVMESAVVPRTGYQRPKGNARDTDEATFTLGQEVGKVINYTVLEHCVVFVTDTKKAFAAEFTWNNGAGLISEPTELTALQGSSEGQAEPSVTDVQGSFRSFAVFKQGGEILIADQDYLHACIEGGNLPRVKRIPALQHNGVISIAFGDYHYHALHSNGHITSYGRESQNCGALGLGGDGDPEGQLRGIRYEAPWRDGNLLPHAYTHGRRVWFEAEKKQWIKLLASGGNDPDEAKERMRMWQNETAVQGELSEWVEQRGRDWYDGLDLRDADEHGLGAYFALSVAAAGWHSGALVLVNDALAAQAKQRCIVEDASSAVEAAGEGAASGGRGLVASTIQRVNNWARWFLGLPSSTDATDEPDPQLQARAGPLHGLQPGNHGASPGKGFKYIWAEDPFPRLRLSDGREMPGDVPLAEWRDGRPEWKLDIDV